MKKRQKTRFKVESLPAQLDVNLVGVFGPTIHGVVINESQTGCCLVIRNDSEVTQGQKLRAKVGHLHPMKAEVVWITELDLEVIKLGLEYTLED